MDKGGTPKLTFEADSHRVLVPKPVYFSTRKFDIMETSYDHDHHRILNSPDHHPRERRVVDEMDFFANETSNSKDASEIDVKKESAILEEELELNVNTGLDLGTTNTTVSEKSTVDDGASSETNKQIANELAVLQWELGKMNTENQRLRAMLSQVNSKYYALQMHILAVMQRQPNPKAGVANYPTVDAVLEEEKLDMLAPRQFMDLGQATIRQDEDDNLLGSPHRMADVLTPSKSQKNGRTIDMRKSSRDESPVKNYQEWSANKVPKINPSNDADQATEATVRKARVSVRARSEASMISDGCQWRKYGQKLAKGNPCPRAYYRCAMAVGCPVRKQVQRCADDRTILITTYEGHHNHPLPQAAMTMASTTSAAASMLLSGSMPSADGLLNSNVLARTILPCSPNLATVSASAPFPSVTLDLTNPSILSNLHRPQIQSQFHIPPSNLPHNFPMGNELFGQSLLNQSKFPGLQNSQEDMSAATSAIAADPNFTAALVAAISSMFCNVNPNTNTSINNATRNSSEGNMGMSNLYEIMK